MNVLLISDKKKLKSTEELEKESHKTYLFWVDVTKIGKARVVSRVIIQVGARSCDAMYRVRESKSKLEHP